MQIRVFKFGGASVNSAEGVANVASIIRKSEGTPLVAVVSAMGKTTNALEEVLEHYLGMDPIAVINAFQKVKDFHFNIMDALFPGPTHPVYDEVGSLFEQLRGIIRKGHLYAENPVDRDHEYDRIVSYGELFSSSIVHHYLVLQGIDSTFLDVRTLIRTNSLFRDARVDWNATGHLIRNAIPACFEPRPGPGKVAVTQGFLGCDPAGNTTTLGREGSDFSAAIFAFVLHATEMTIWKDVPGVMNADPKLMPDAVCLETLSYREAIELAYYGASIIHPKTIKPLENAGIILHVKSFLDPGREGTVIKNVREWKIPTPIFILKKDQVLISVSSRDFSFILEENLSEIFRILARFRVKVNIMQNSAISFSVCVDNDPHKVTPLLDYLGKNYETRYNHGLKLYTIRHYNDPAIDRVTKGKKVLMELRSRNTYQGVMERSR